jgi:hypothetical protein
MKPKPMTVKRFMAKWGFLETGEPLPELDADMRVDLLALLREAKRKGKHQGFIEGSNKVLDALESGKR